MAIPAQAMSGTGSGGAPGQRGGRSAAPSQQAAGGSEETQQQISRVAVGGRPEVSALAITGGVELDGVLDEDVWRQAERGTAFTQREPFQGEPATEQTFVQVLYSDDTLYIGVRALDSDPPAVIAKDMQRDGSGSGFFGSRLESDDSIVVLLDTFHDQRNAFYFETNPLAARVDAMITDEGRDRNFEWDGVWNVAARRTEEGWSAEFEIPFNTLRFNPANDTWGLNVRRMIRRKSEEVNWSPIMRDADMYRVSQYGQLNNMRAGDPSRNLRFKPFATASGDEGIDTDVGDLAGDAQVGLDVRWGVTDSMTFDLTINTDFAQVEADEQRVNLTRFSLFFPEKREFFLENAGIFQFASGGGGRGGGGGGRCASTTRGASASPKAMRSRSSLAASSPAAPATGTSACSTRRRPSTCFRRTKTTQTSSRRSSPPPTGRWLASPATSASAPTSGSSSPTGNRAPTTGTASSASTRR